MEVSLFLLSLAAVTGFVHGADEYGAIIDAGSTGSRIYIYSWPETTKPDQVPDVQELFSYKVKPGLSDFTKNLDGLDAYLLELLTEGKKHVPESVQDVTPIYLMATAGMRLLLADRANDVMEKIDSVFSDSSVNPFLYESVNTRILSGEEEGVFGWITINFLRGFFKAEEGTMEHVGVLDFGGASTQITFAPDVSILADKFPVKIGGVIYPLYVHSYLYYGKEHADMWVKEYMYKMDPQTTPYDDPCYPVGAESEIVINGLQLTFSGTGHSDLCLELLNQLVYDVADDRCYPKPCAIGSVYQPVIDGSMPFVGITNFFYALSSINGSMEDDGTFVPETVLKAAKAFCEKNIGQLENETGQYDSIYLKTYCLAGLYMPILLTEGFGFSSDTRQLTAVQEINGVEAAWTVGAIIYENQRKDWDGDCSGVVPLTRMTVVSMTTVMLLGNWAILGAVM